MRHGDDAPNTEHWTNRVVLDSMPRPTLKIDWTDTMEQMPLVRKHVGERLSDIAVWNGVVYLAGQIPNVTVGSDIATQTQEVLHIIDSLLDEAASSKRSILFAQIYLRTSEDFSEMNRVWDLWVPAGNAPPRATVQAQAMRLGVDVEIVVTAALEG